jgi:hypothetical protein
MKKTRRLSKTLPLVDEELFLQPWFITRPLHDELRRLLPPSQMLKMRYYFDDFGCLRCQSQTAMYRSNGMCTSCFVLVHSRVIGCLRKRFQKIGIESGRAPVKRYLERLAKEVDYSKAGSPSIKRRQAHKSR